MGGNAGKKPAAGIPYLLAALFLALVVICAAFPAAPAHAAVVDPAQGNIPSGWPWKIKYLAYPTLGYPQIIKAGEAFTLEFDCIGKGAGGPQPDISTWQVRLFSSNDRWPTAVDCPVQNTVKAVSNRWFQGSLPQTEANGEWAGPWSGDEVWHVTAGVPASARPDLYDLKVTAAGAVSVMDTQPHAVQVVEEYKDDYDFIQVSDFHINDPRGPSDSFIPGRYPDPDEFKDYLYNRKVIDDINLINPDFVVMTGDLPFGYPSWAHIFCPLLDPNDKRTDYTGKAPGWDGEYDAAYEQLLRLEVPVVCMPGNHDSYNLQSQLGPVLPHTHGFAQDGAHIWPTMIGPRYFGWDYGDELSFTTDPTPPTPTPTPTPVPAPALPGPPTNVEVAESGLSSVTVTWDLGYLSTHTLVRASPTANPESITDGYEIYFGTEGNCTVSGLSLQTGAYWISLWGYNDQGYSRTYTTANTGGAGMIAQILFLGILVIVALWRRGVVECIAAIIGLVLIMPTLQSAGGYYAAPAYVFAIGFGLKLLRDAFTRQLEL